MTFPANITALIQDRLKPKNDAQDARLDAIEAFIADRHVLQNNAIVVNTVTATPTTAISGNVTVDGGTYQIGISYLWNGDASSSDFQTQFTVGGNELVVGGAQGFLHKQEPKDVANGGSQVTGTGSGQRMGFTKVFENVALTAGAQAVEVLIGPETNGVEASFWNVDVWIQRTVL